jgi:hypothetical protein
MAKITTETLNQFKGRMKRYEGVKCMACEAFYHPDRRNPLFNSKPASTVPTEVVPGLGTICQHCAAIRFDYRWKYGDEEGDKKFIASLVDNPEDEAVVEIIKEEKARDMMLYGTAFNSVVFSAGR